MVPFYNLTKLKPATTGGYGMLKLTKDERHERMIAIHGSGKPLTDHVDEILAINEQLVQSQARHNARFNRTGLDVNDFIQIGLLAITHCCDNFKPEEHVNDLNNLDEIQEVWKSYMYKRIKNKQRNLNRLKKYENENGLPTSLEVATASDDDDTKLHEVIEDEGADKFADLFSMDYKIIAEMIESETVLTERERTTIIHKLGLWDQPILKNVEIADIIGVTKADVKNQFDRGIRKLRARLIELDPSLI